CGGTLPISASKETTTFFNRLWERRAPGRNIFTVACKFSLKLEIFRLSEFHRSPISKESCGIKENTAEHPPLIVMSNVLTYFRIHSNWMMLRPCITTGTRIKVAP
ncbi:hypothetical protein CEXT_264611, partial [Caerostris extrusa]